MKITKDSDIKEVASIVCNCLLQEGIEAILSGGAVVSIYTANEYESKDLDFISSDDSQKIEKALAKIGFQKTAGRYYSPPETQYFVEFPKPPLAIGSMPVKEWAIQNNKAGKLLLLSPTHSVMDRLAGYFYWNDKQNLDQAIMIARKHAIKMKNIENWARSEGELEKFKVFQEKLLTKPKRQGK